MTTLTLTLTPDEYTWLLCLLNGVIDYTLEDEDGPITHELHTGKAQRRALRAIRLQIHSKL